MCLGFFNSRMADTNSLVECDLRISLFLDAQYDACKLLSISSKENSTNGRKQIQIDCTNLRRGFKHNISFCPLST